jgi:hypothetical protein
VAESEGLMNSLNHDNQFDSAESNFASALPEKMDKITVQTADDKILNVEVDETTGNKQRAKS